MNLFRIAVVLHLFLWPFGVCLASTADVDELKHQAVSLKLYDQQRWLMLGHYHKGGHRNDWVSYADDSQFFLSGRGENSPEAELLATLDALSQPYSAYASDNNHHPRCRFVARYHWLAEQLNIDLNSQFGEIGCGEYQKWQKVMNADSITLVYASSYLNSPSSMYGHTFLRIDPPQVEKNSAWLSWAVNFGANIPMGENSFRYAYLGLAGGYPGLFNVLPYYEKIKEYNHMENRDLWEYRINLTKEEVSWLVEHLWELRDIRFDYYFIDENCSFRLLELLEFARPGKSLTDSFDYKAIPVDTVREVINNDFVKEIHYRPSVITGLQHAINQLSDEEQQYAVSLADNPDVLQDKNYHKLPEERRADIVNVSYSFLRNRERKNVRDEQMAKTSFKLLREMNSLPVRNRDAVPEPFHPDLGHESAMLGMALGQADDTTYVDLNARLSFHDLLDRKWGYIHGAAITMGNLLVRADENDRVHLQKLELIDVHSLSPRDVFFKSYSWRVNSGFDRVLTAAGEEPVFQGNAGGGLSYNIGDAVQYTMLTARLEHNDSFASDNDMALGTAMGLLWYQEQGTTLLEINGDKFAQGYWRQNASLLHNLVIAKDWAVRFGLGYHHYQDIEFSDVSVALRHYY